MHTFEALNVKKHFQGVIALKGAGIKVESNKICGLVGANGSGKSTFSRICAGLIKPDCASFSIDGTQVQIENYEKAKQHKIALVHQNLSLIPDLTVWENIVLGNESFRGSFFLDNKSDRETASRTLKELTGDSISLDVKVSELSPGEQMLVEISKALYCNPDLLILDEPTAALEYKQVESLFAKIEECKKRGVLIVFISHRIWEITRICDVVYAFRNGESAGTVDFEKQERDEQLILPLVTGEESFLQGLERKIQNFSELHSSEAIKLENLSFLTKLNRISLKADKGEIIGIGGLTGQGQEELLRVISGELQPTEGSIILKGDKIRINNVKHAIREGIYYIPGDRQRDGLFMTNDVLFNTILPRMPLRSDSYVPNISKLNSLTDDIIEKTALHPKDRTMIVGNLSGGNQQKVVLGKWLQFAPSVLLLNDPAKGIDIGAMKLLYKIIHELAENGTTVILYASSNEELICNCDRVLVMFEGSLVKELSGNQLTDENLIKYSLRITV